MNSSTITSMFGINPNNFKPTDINPICSDVGFVYYLEQSTDKIPCPFCNSSNNVTIKGYYFKNINCSINEHKKDVLRIKMVRFNCYNCNKTFNKSIQGVQKYGCISNYVKKLIINSFYTTTTFDKIASTYHVSIATIINIFDKDIADVKRLKLPKILCIDEFYFSKDNDNKYCCILVDWETKQIVDIIKNRQLAYLDDYFSKIPQNELKNVKYFVSDMYDGYATIKNKYFPKADHIIDLFHIVIQLNRVTNSIRCSVMKSLPDDSIEKKFMSSHWKLFLCKSSLIPSSKIFTSHKLNASCPIFELLFKCVKMNPSLNYAYTNLQEVYNLPKNQYFKSAMKSIQFIIDNLRLSNDYRLIQVANTYDKWKIGIAHTLSMHKGYSNISNGPAEGANNLISNILHASFGFQNFSRFRKRALLLLRRN